MTNPLIKMPEIGDLVVIKYSARRENIYPIGKTGLIKKVEGLDFEKWFGNVEIDWTDGNVTYMQIINFIQMTNVAIDGKFVSWSNPDGG